MAVDTFINWFAAYLKDRGLRSVRCGSKVTLGPNQTHDIDLETGDWSRPGFSSGKAPRWLYHLVPAEDGLQARPLAEGSQVIAYANTRSSDRAAIVVRLLPLIGTSDTGFVSEDDFEIRALFVFPNGAPEGTSSETFAFDVDTGVLIYQGKPLQYVVSGLLGIQPRQKSFEVNIGGLSQSYSYGQITDAIASSISILAGDGEKQQIGVFDLTEDAGVELLRQAIQGNWPSPDDLLDPEDEAVVVQGPLEIPTNPDLIGVDRAVYRQINAVLQAGKQHIILYGPPGTGKTTLARWIASSLTGDQWELITGSSDWSSQDIIGGYQPTGPGSVAFIPGVLLRNFDRPLIIDELNRCDIDKVIGPLFTVLSGQQTTLPYRLDISDANSQHYTILPQSKPERSAHEYAPGPGWRIIATINSIDKASLYQMSYALSRRFGWIYVDVPQDTRGFLAEFLSKEDPSWSGPSENSPCPLAEFWSVTNKVRPLGPAPVIDAIKTIQIMDSAADFFGPTSLDMREYLLDAIDMTFLPLLDGIAAQDGDRICQVAIDSFELDEAQQNRIRRRLESVTV